MVIDLIQGDCLEVMKTLPTESIHSVISDIPYGISFSKWDVLHNNTNSALLGTSPAQEKSKLFKSRGKPKNGWSEKDKQIPYDYQEFCKSFLTECLRLLKPAGNIICFTGRQFQHRFVCAGEDLGFIFKDTLTWNKIKAPFRAQRINKVLSKRGLQPTDDFRLGNLAPKAEPIVWMFKPYKIGTTLTDCFIQFGTGCFNPSEIKSNIIEYNAHVKDRKHETEKPLGLMEIIIKTFVQENQTVLDPFMGSGTTGLACKNLNRKFIGIELNETYFNIAKKKINR